MNERASIFELVALVKALLRRGFAFDELRFEGARELQPPRGALVQELCIQQRPQRRATIRVNAGLLAADSPLPDYFRDFASRLIDPDPLLQFLGFWDAAMLRDLVRCSIPALVDTAAPDSRLCGLLPGYRAQLRLDNPTVLHWLFRSLFPELPVTVHAACFARRSGADRARVGSHLDGRSTIGGSFGQRVSGFRVRLHVASARLDGVRDWEREAGERLMRSDGDLRGCSRPVEVVMNFEAYRHGQALVGATDARRQLGVRPWLFPSPENPTRSELYGPGEVLLWHPWLPAARVADVEQRPAG